MSVNNRLTLDCPAVYSIQIQGMLDQNWVQQFGDMRQFTTVGDSTMQAPVTTIIGRVTDQAALAGILNLVYNLGLPLLSVTYLGSPN
jgi:hypothetical protein